VKESVVADSACLIALERIGCLDLLPALFESIVIPPEVEREFGVSVPWLKVKAPTNHSLVASLKMLVDDGEAEALALACENRSNIILDDRRARSIAKNLTLPMIGTVGILVRAKHAGIIPALKPLLDSLELNNFYISEALKAEALRLAGE
jgi:predicted nucleic acid-binding protein